jgi:outer membrane immunogenic protein
MWGYSMRRIAMAALSVAGLSLVGIVAISAVMGTPASAADMSIKAPAPVPYNWTGFYLGGEVGGGWATDTVTHDAASTLFPNGFVDSSVHPSGVLGGIYGGYNYQINHLVLGIDGDYTWSHLSGTATETTPIFSFASTVHDNVNWIATVTGRIGYANDNWLFFAKAGGAWTGWSSNGTVINTAGALDTMSTSSTNRDGWTVGGGLEYGLGPHVSVKLEYDYVGLEVANFNLLVTKVSTGVVTAEPRSATSSLNMIKAGVDYRF